MEGKYGVLGSVQVRGDWQDGGGEREGKSIFFLSIIEQIIRQIFVRICRQKVSVLFLKDNSF